MRRLAFIAIVLTCSFAHAQSVIDPRLRVNKWVGGFNQPTSVAFLDSSTLLVTEKNTGRVRLVENRAITKTVLDLPVNSDSERGLLSIALSPNFASDNFVYFYHTAASTDGGDAISNKISRYRWNGANKTLSFDRKIIDLPPGPGPNHDGGKIVFSPNGKLFAVIGDLNRDEQTTNHENQLTTNCVAAIIRLQPDGKVVPQNPFPSLGSQRTATQDIYAYGIRNSFGLAFDPVTGDLWDTENGPDRMDEINRVTPGMNSGWQDVMGPISRSGATADDLVSLGLRANYQDPKLSWASTVAPTDLEFLSSSRLGSEYRNDLFVGDVNTGQLYRFELTSNRKSLQLPSALSDRVVDDGDDASGIIFGDGFGVTSDLLTGPGGLFVLSLSNGSLYRISENPSGVQARVHAVPEPSVASLLIASVPFLRRRKRTSVTRATSPCARRPATNTSLHS